MHTMMRLVAVTNIAILLCGWPITRGWASEHDVSDDRVEQLFEFRRDQKSLLEGLKSSNSNRRVRSAIYLWNNYPGHKKQVEKLMEEDASIEVRRRIAQVLAVKHRLAKAVGVLKKTLKEVDITTHAGASGFLMGINSLYSASGEVMGLTEAQAILAAPATWFADVAKSSYSFSQRDALRVMAASFLVDHQDKVDKVALQEALRAYVADVERAISRTTGTERKYWEMRLPTVLDIARRIGMPELALGFEGRESLLENEYERMRLKRVIERSKKREK